MSSSFGTNIKVQIFGQSHSEMLGVVIDGLPVGYEIDMEYIQAFLDRRRGGKNAWSTARAEADTARVVSGLLNGVTCGAPLCALFENADVRSEDYDELKDVPRPSHADFYAREKYRGWQDTRGGGHFSGRMTLPLCFAGAVCKQILEEWDIYLGAHIEQLYTELDEPYDPVSVSREDLLYGTGFPVNDSAIAERMQALMCEAAESGDSLGGTIECAVIGMNMGDGAPIFDGIANRLSAAIFAVPAVRGIEFGAGFEAAGMRGSEHNDAFFVLDEDGGDQDRALSLYDWVGHRSNNAGGIVGGLATGMPIIFRAVIKPTPSIALEQDSVNLRTKEEVKLSIEGRHDACIVPRAVPCIEAAAAIALMDVCMSVDS